MLISCLLTHSERCVLVKEMHFTKMVGQHTEVGTFHLVQAPSPTLDPVASVSLAAEVGRLLEKGVVTGWFHPPPPPQVTPRVLLPLFPGSQEIRGDETHSGSKLFQLVNCCKEIQKALHQSVSPMCERRRLFHNPGSQGCLLPCPYFQGSLEISPLGLHGRGVGIPVPAILLLSSPARE